MQQAWQFLFYSILSQHPLQILNLLCLNQKGISVVLFINLRDKNFNAVGAALSKKAKLISSQMEERHNDQTVQGIKHFVARLPHMLTAKKHLAKREHTKLKTFQTISIDLSFIFIYHRPRYYYS